MKRTRASNFTNAEIMHLLRLVDKYPIIKCKKTNAATTAEKQEAWKDLTVDYNSTTVFERRSTENLVACYKNQKIKVKKLLSGEKNNIKVPLTQPGPPFTPNHIAELIIAVEENGQDWDLVSQSTNMSSQDCKNAFEELVKRAKKHDSDFIKEVPRTGGLSPQPSSPTTDVILEKVKTLIGPNLGELYTVYDGDAEVMKQQQELTHEKKIEPIDYKPLTSKTPTTVATGRKKNTAEQLLKLAEDKKELIKIKKKLTHDQLIYQQQVNAINLESLKEKLEHEKKLNNIELEYQKNKKNMEIDFLKEKYELELNLLRNK